MPDYFAPLLVGDGHLEKPLIRVSIHTSNNYIVLLSLYTLSKIRTTLHCFFMVAIKNLRAKNNRRKNRSCLRLHEEFVS